MSIIAHLDLDAFFCAVEELYTPSLRGKPFAVGGSPDQRGVVASCSYPARAMGVHSAMPMSSALRLCPSLLVVQRHHDVYKSASRQVMQKIHALGVPVEQISIDEAFFDLSETKAPEAVARRLQEAIYTDLHLPCSIGIASNKLVAKIANDVGKASANSKIPPRAFTVIPSGSEAAFLSPLPVRKLWGVGPKTAERLEKIGISTIGDLAKQDEVAMLRRFGQSGYELTRRARGIDTRSLVTKRKTKSVSQERTFSIDKSDGDALRQVLKAQAKEISEQLKRKNLLGRTIRIKLRWSDFTTLTRQITLETPTNEVALISRVAEKLFSSHWEVGRTVRLLGVGVSGLEKAQPQIGLWDQDWEKESQVSDTLDELQARFGKDIIKRGVEKQEKAKKRHA